MIINEESSLISKLHCTLYMYNTSKPLGDKIAVGLAGVAGQLVLHCIDKVDTTAYRFCTILLNFHVLMCTYTCTSTSWRCEKAMRD